MTSRERFMAAMRLEQPDCVPVCPDISNMIPCRLTGKPFWDVYFHRDPPLWQAYADAVDYYGFDGWYNNGGITFETKTQIEITQKIVSHTDERLTVRRFFKTPAGELTEEVIYPVADPPTCTERKVKNLREDLPRLMYFYEEPIDCDVTLFEEIRRRAGEKGIVCHGVGNPGFHHYVGFMDGGLEALVYAYYDHTDLFEELTERIHRQEVRMCEMICEVKPDCIVTGGSGSITMQSPDLWRKLSLPTLREVCRIAKEAGVLTMVHSCGMERELVKTCAEETELDCVNPLEIPPMGDCDLAEIKRSFGDRISLMGNLNTTDVMLRGAPGDVERAAKKAIDDAGAGGGFILSTGDQCGRDTPDENIFKLVEVARTYGRYD